MRTSSLILGVSATLLAVGCSGSAPPTSGGDVGAGGVGRGGSSTGAAGTSTAAGVAGSETGGTGTAPTGGGGGTGAMGGRAVGGRGATAGSGGASAGAGTSGAPAAGVGGGAGTLGAGGASSGGVSAAGASASGAGGVSTAGAPSGGAPTAGAGGGGGCPPSAAVCENFESGSFGSGWKKIESGGTLTVDSTHYSEGTQSLAISIPAQQRGGFLEFNGAPLFPLTDNSIYGRVMVYFESIPDGHTDIVRGAATNNATPQYNVAEQHGEYMMNYYNGSAADCWARPMPTQKVPLAKWMCWEWEFHGPTNELDFYVDGTLARKVSGMGDGCLATSVTWTAPTFATFRIGEYIAELGNTAVKMWLDDIAVGNTERIGCPSSSIAK